jgi:hypothetical protein
MFEVMKCLRFPVFRRFLENNRRILRIIPLRSRRWKRAAGALI